MNATDAVANGPGIPWAIFISAAVVIIAAFIGGWWQHRIQRQVLTFKNISDLMWDADYIAARKKFIRLRDSDGAALIGLAQKDQQASDDASAIRAVLNDYELVAIGIEKGILAGDMIKDFYRSTLVLDCSKIMPFIEEIRRVQNNKLLYVKFEQLAKKWA